MSLQAAAASATFRRIRFPHSCRAASGFSAMAESLLGRGRHTPASSGASMAIEPSLSRKCTISAWAIGVVGARRENIRARRRCHERTREDSIRRCVQSRASVLIGPDMPNTPSQSAEDYLERIHELIEEKGYARVVDIAESLDVKQASVTVMVQKLGELGFLDYVKYRGLRLTAKGRDVARRIQSRHATLARFFSLLGLDQKTQRMDIEGIEHHLSPDTLACLEDLSEFLERNPAVIARFKKFRRTAKPA